MSDISDGFTRLKVRAVFSYPNIISVVDNCNIDPVSSYPNVLYIAFSFIIIFLYTLT